MKLKTLIKKLSKIQAEHGNLDCEIWDGRFFRCIERVYDLNLKRGKKMVKIVEII